MSLSPELLAHLSAAQNPEDPAFASALAHLQALDPHTLARDDMPALIALLDSAIANLSAGKEATSRELEGLRSRSALNAYTQHK